jgi:hypothetical protein
MRPEPPAIARSRPQRGLAMVVVLSMVVLLTVLVAFAITVSNQDRGQAGKQISNATVNSVLEAALQYGKGMFAANYLTSNKWGDYLALDYTGLPTTVPAGHNELVVPSLPGGYTCVVYARDNIDEQPSNPSVDNDLRIFVGAVCQTPDRKIAEISAPLDLNPTSLTYGSQGSGGTHGTNTAARTTTFRTGP